MTEKTGRKRHTSASLSLTTSQMGPSSCGKMSSGLPLILHCGEWYTYFIIKHSVITTEMKCARNEMPLNHPDTRRRVRLGWSPRWAEGRVRMRGDLGGERKGPSQPPITDSLCSSISGQGPPSLPERQARLLGHPN